MGKLLVYWIVGCMMVGGAIANHLKICPNDPMPSTMEVLGSVAVWPVPMFGAIFMIISGRAARMNVPNSSAKVECQVP